MESRCSRPPSTSGFLQYSSQIDDGDNISQTSRYPRTSYTSQGANVSEDAINLIEHSPPLGLPYPRPSQIISSRFQYDIDNGVTLRSPIRQLFWSWILSVVASVWVIFTVYFAYNCTLDRPLSTRLMFSRPDNTILALNVLSHGTIFLLGHLTSSVFEAVRWALASSKNGISVFSFIGLSRATSPLGVMTLMVGNAGSKLFARDGHRLWGFQR